MYIHYCVAYIFVIGPVLPDITSDKQTNYNSLLL